MSDEYLSSVILDVNGEQIDDFKSVEEKEFEVRKTIELARKTGTVAATPRYGLTIEYGVPKDRPVFDFAGVADGRITLDFENGTRRTYSGCSCIKIGSVKYDGTSEATCQIEFAASGRSEE